MTDLGRHITVPKIVFGHPDLAMRPPGLALPHPLSSFLSHSLSFSSSLCLFFRNKTTNSPLSHGSNSPPDAGIRHLQTLGSHLYPKQRSPKSSKKMLLSLSGFLVPAVKILNFFPPYEIIISDPSLANPNPM